MSMRDQCGIFGIYGHPQAAQITYFGLYALQHRGQESSGIVTSDGQRLLRHVGMGLVADVFKPDTFTKLPGHIAIGHNRYSTTGSSHITNAQPFLVDYKNGPLALGHNGNLVNALELRRQMEATGSIFQSTSDTEIIPHLIARASSAVENDAYIEAFRQIRGAFSLLMLTPKKLIAVRDPAGFRPLSLGKLEKSFVIASESCAFDLVGATYIRSLAAGEMLVIDENGSKSYFPFDKVRLSQCVFEYVYFSRPDSKVFGENADRVRRQMGRHLAEEHPAQADIVISVPDSSNTAALGYAEASKIPFEIGLIRNHYIGRTFIYPSQEIRDLGVRIKFNPVAGVLKKKRVVVVDDSIVRGTTCKKLVKMIRTAGATEIHLRISSSPVRWPCYYGIDMPTREELIAANMNLAEMTKYLEVDSLGYLSIDGMLRATFTEQPAEHFCKACFDGEYPVTVPGMKK